MAHSRDGTTGAQLLAAMRACTMRLPRTPFPPFANTAEPDRPLTVGVLSSSLRSHPVGWLTVVGIETLDPAQFSAVCLSQNTELADPITRRFHVIAREWLDVDTLSDTALAQAARDRGIDILLDLGGYGDAARMP